MRGECKEHWPKGNTRNFRSDKNDSHGDRTLVYTCGKIKNCAPKEKG